MIGARAFARKRALVVGPEPQKLRTAHSELERERADQRDGRDQAGPDEGIAQSARPGRRAGRRQPQLVLPRFRQELELVLHARLACYAFDLRTANAFEPRLLVEPAPLFRGRTLFPRERLARFGVYAFAFTPGRRLELGLTTSFERAAFVFDARALVREQVVQREKQRRFTELGQWNAPFA